MLQTDAWSEAMRAGDFERAWMITDRDLQMLSLPPKHTGPRHQQRIWRGEDLSGKRVLVRCYHGLGDTIQYLRFMPFLRAIAGHVTVWCQQDLRPLVQGVGGVDCAIPLHDGAPDVPFDVDIEIMEVPHAIRAGRKAIAMTRPYLELADPSAPVINPRATDLAVGLVWEAGSWDDRRSIPAHLLRGLAGEGVALYALQRGAAAGNCDLIGATDISTPDIMLLGHLLRRLDLTICVDTMVAHLAGALGCEAWVLLHAECDWRWPASASRTPWYPSLRLFHQRAMGDWTGVLAEVKHALLQRAASKRADAEGVNADQADATCSAEGADRVEVVEASGSPGRAFSLR